MAGISNFMDKTLKGYEMDAGSLWQHSITVAIGSKIIAERVRPDLDREVFFPRLLWRRCQMPKDSPDANQHDTTADQDYAEMRKHEARRRKHRKKVL